MKISFLCGRSYDQNNQQLNQWLSQSKYFAILMENEL